MDQKAILTASGWQIVRTHCGPAGHENEGAEKTVNVWAGWPERASEVESDRESTRLLPPRQKKRPGIEMPGLQAWEEEG